MVVAQDEEVDEPFVVDPGGPQLARLGGHEQAPRHQRYPTPASMAAVSASGNPTTLL